MHAESDPIVSGPDPRSDHGIGDAVADDLAALYACRTSTAVLTDPSRATPLAAIERVGTENFAPKRLAEFRAGRHCARQALARLGSHPPGVARNADRSPAWPAGIIGSISHCDTIVAAVAARRTEARALGLDVECWRALPPGVAALVRAPGERIAPAVDHPATLLFSAKEALYKCQAPVTGRFLDFGEVALDLAADSAATGRFAARLLDASHPAAPVVAAIRGRWRVRDGWVMTGALLPL